jgi:hypothetical protein
MLALFTGALLAVVRHEEAPSGRRLLVAGLTSSACVLVKPLCLFGIVGAFVALRASASGWRGLLRASSWLFGASIVLPTLAYYVYGIYIAGFLGAQAEASFVPALLTRRDFWVSTALVAVSVLGIVPLCLALLGATLPANRLFRPLLVGLVAGYAVLCIVFTFHVRMAGHYHLQLAVAVGVALGPVVAALVDRVRQAPVPPVWRTASLAASVLLVSAGTGRAISTRIASMGPIVDPAVAREVGETVGHSDRVVYVSQYYGVPLEYFGWLSGWYFPREGGDIERALGVAERQSVEQRLLSLRTALARAEESFRPDHFVITDFRGVRSTRGPGRVPRGAL